MANLIDSYYSLNIPMDADDLHCQKFVGYFDTLAEAEAKVAELKVTAFEINKEYIHENDGVVTSIW